MDLARALGIDTEQAQEENTVSYEIFPASRDVSQHTELEALRTQLLDHLLPSLRGYIWQRDRFALHLSTQRSAPWQRSQRRRRGSARRGPAAAGERERQQQQELPPHLWGSANFGDNIEDEWFVVWLLLELTRAFPVTARVWDNDGEFLLIEAAYGLPRWLKPETAQNRVWLHGGAFHLVPLPRCAGDPLLGATPSLEQALAAVQGNQVDTAAPPKMQAALLPRVSGYPGRAAEQMHVAHALVPARVAYLLRAEPQLLAAAVEAFHYRDVDDVKAAARMAAFPPRDMLLAAPTFSRCLYAQLALQEFAPPRGYPMPMPSDPQFKAAEVGLKLTAGFEMMYANRARFGQAGDEEGEEQAATHDEQAAIPAAAGQPGDEQAAAGQPGAAPTSAAGSAAAALAGDAAWPAFLARLESSGYFRGSLPGSAQHSELLAAAADSYRQTAAYRTSTAALAAPALRAEALLSQQPADLPGSFPPPVQLPPEGSEAWLQAGADARLEGELAARQAEQEAEAQRKQQQQQRGVRQRGGKDSSGQQPGGSRSQQPGGSSTGQQPVGGSAGKPVFGNDPSGDGGGDDGFDPGQMAGQLRVFIDMMAGLEGAEVPGETTGSGGAAGDGGGVALDEAKFAAELQRVLGLGKDLLSGLEQREGAGGGGGEEEEGSGSESSDEGSSFFSGERSEEDSDFDGEAEHEENEEEEQQQHVHVPLHVPQPSSHRRQQQRDAGRAAARPATTQEEEEEEEEEGGRQEGWEADTATDSDDDAQFMDAYSKAMDAQLSGTRMAESFERAPAPSAIGDAALQPPARQQQGGAPPPAAGAAAAGAAAGEEDAAEAAAEAAALRPVDIDLNLVNSLLASYSEQQGLPGPAGSLAGLLGLKLPDQPTGSRS